MGEKSKSDFIKLKTLVENVGFKPRLFFCSIFLSLIASGFEAISIAFMLPVSKSIVERNFLYFSSGVKKIFFDFYLNFSNQNLDINQFNLSFFIFLVACLVFFKFLSLAFDYFTSYFFATWQFMLGHRIREQVFSRYMCFGKSYYDQNSLGTLQTIIFEYTGILLTYSSRIQAFFSWSFLLSAYLFLMFYISFKLTLVFFALSPIIYFSITFVKKRLRQTSRDLSLITKNLSRHFSNVIGMMSIVKVFQKERDMQQRFSMESQKVSMFAISIQKKTILLGPLQEVVMLFAVFLVFIFLGINVESDPNFDVSKVLIFIYSAKRANTSFAVIMSAVSNLSAISGPLTDLAEIFSDDEKFIFTGGKEKVTSFKDKIIFKDLTFSFLKQNLVLKNLNLTIEKGKTVALVGQTGAGKSTILNLIQRFYECPQNTIFVDGVDICDINIDSWRNLITVVSQDCGIFNETLRYNLTFGSHEKNISDEKILKVIEMAQLSELVATLPLGLDTIVGDRGVMLSGGERQRLSIARAFLRGSEIIILDEATSALDSVIEEKIQKAIDLLLFDKTAIIVAHRLSTIKNSDIIYVIDKGQVIEFGNYDELIKKNGLFFEFVTKQQL